ncbi:DUF971 domain-containing protein [Pseudomonas sp. KNUC1026]|uniref:DUF971 domain-containing protein n=1 Tax=Pseudomonas sp. KNUC1026 TaxID=2893890 RepID=UPI001F23CADB|nr:gamma-butyrobetaine hydroxylase-like domain-containing protein [Pseudomonas sp. KNUC1026]UFH51089.1 gamma-butyrobetaine hydroxylase-like domain-containing protein [Pseudomonas sp. KNUC1026]
MSAPLSVIDHTAAGELEIRWPGEPPVRVPHARLRAACPCSTCRAARLRGRIDSAPAQVQLVLIEAQGYGVQLGFSDGHERGIYPWVYLRELAQLL